MKTIVEEIDPDLVQLLNMVLLNYFVIREELIERLNPSILNDFFSRDFKEELIALNRSSQTGSFRICSNDFAHIGILLSIYQKVLDDLGQVSPKEIERLNKRLLAVFRPETGQYH